MEFVWWITALVTPVLLVTAWYYWTKRYVTVWKPEGSRIFITGGSKGIGKAIAVELIKQGASVLISARTESKLLETQKELNGAHEDRCFILAADVSNEDDFTEKLNAKLKEIEWDSLDAVVCNAGVHGTGLFDESETKFAKRVMNINYWGGYHTAKMTLPYLKESLQNPRLLFVGSLFSLVGFGGQSAYVPTKFAMRGLAEVLAQEFYPYVTVSIVYPPDVETDQLKEEQANQPKMTRLMQGETETIQAKEVATGIVSTLINGSYSYSWTFDGFMIHSVTPGLACAPSLLNTLWCVFLSGITRCVTLWYAMEWLKITKKCNKNKVKMCT